MKKFSIFLLLFTVYGLLITDYVYAESKNIFGLHLTQPQDVHAAAKIINSQGGDWGYVTAVIRLDQLNTDIWQEFFDDCRRLHLIPLIRLGTIMENGYWKKPEVSDIDHFAGFLNSLNWPTQKQHIIVFNETNHGTEWGGKVDIRSFADISIYAYQKFKSLNTDFEILSGALDLAAPNKKDEYNSAAKVYRDIYNYRPEYFDNLDAISSHSYPNHGFVGTPNDTGQHSIRGYSWELQFIKSLGVSKTFPVYITETGWPHREGEKTANNFYTSKTTVEFLTKALQIWSKDPRVVAVTPFIFNYPNPPFDHFSWLDQSGKLLPAYEEIARVSKNANRPEQKTSFEVVANHIPFILITGTEYSGRLVLKNTGQSIWGETKFCLMPESTTNVTLDAICTSDQQIPPGNSATFDYKLTIKPDKDYHDRTLFSWNKIPSFEVTPLSGSGYIYSPKTTFKQKIIQYFQSWFI